MSRPNVNVQNLKGEYGGIYITDNAAHVGDFDSIVALTACTANLVASNITGAAMNGVTIPAGVVLWGRFTSVTLTAGTCIAYNRAAK